ncbi:MAG: hypothetical protein ACYDD1_04275 [Caulobacteraceae bacterium]
MAYGVQSDYEFGGRLHVCVKAWVGRFSHGPDLLKAKADAPATAGDAAGRL